MSQKQQKPITDEQWNEAADAFELGLKHANEIAKELGVSHSTVSRQLKRRGCKKGSRVKQSVAELEAFLDRRARRAALLRQSEREAAADRVAAGQKLIEDMLRTVFAADRAGNLAAAGPEIKKVLKSLK